MNYLDRLPFELLMLILDHVDKNNYYTCLCISKRFYNATLPLLWHHLDIDSEAILNKITIVMAKSSFFPGHHVRQITIRHMVCDTDYLAMIQHVPFLTHVELLQARLITDTSFSQHNPTMLTTLSIRRGSLTHHSMITLGQHFHQLSSLTLALCPGLDYPKLFSALQPCPLKQVCILPHDMTLVETRPFAEAAALALAHQHQLTSLQFQNKNNDYAMFLVTATSHGIIWPCLTRLELAHCRDLQEATAIRFLQAHPQLIYLDWYVR